MWDFIVIAYFILLTVGVSTVGYIRHERRQQRAETMRRHHSTRGLS